MNHHAKHDAVRTSESNKGGAIVLAGGNGGMFDRYRDVAAERGLELCHFEKRVPNGRRVAGKVAAIVIMVGMVSHSLRDQVKGLAPENTPVLYLRSASVSALRNAIATLDA